ncbi:hypothetical protein K435DRAFT_973297 [Dendrothele bispora CBS 962.96]|uniref:Uncharacterized protein n=1 Tax=Dendrothele bispora (strain CBS 962.96) TaxID=1314807 RepID=A0A4S8KTE0_DENBC|nr:hypothetical protein K435DRAFT_973297 [Dendrothele bispora CBS 962.96]
MLRAMWPSINNILNHLPASSGTTSKDLMALTGILTLVYPDFFWSRFRRLVYSAVSTAATALEGSELVYTGNSVFSPLDSVSYLRGLTTQREQQRFNINSSSPSPSTSSLTWSYPALKQCMRSAPDTVISFFQKPPTTIYAAVYGPAIIIEGRRMAANDIENDGKTDNAERKGARARN